MKRVYLKQTRNKNGTPGKNYWQNHADHKIKITFDPVTRAVNGSVQINYTNNSPDTLSRILLNIFPNLYQKQALRKMAVNSSDLGDGLNISEFLIDGKKIDSTNLVTRATLMTVRKVTIHPGQTIKVNIDYAYTLNKGSFIRTGQVEEGAFFLAYFFPRIAVYDDVDGWSEYPYTGHDEFYNDYGSYDVDITVPGDYQVWATGDLTNIDQVYSPQFVERIRQAEKQDEVKNIITETDITTGGITLNSGGLNTWKFHADHVTDFAFSISNHYIWKAASVLVDPKTGRRTRVDAVYNPRHDAYLPVIDYAVRTVKAISYQFPAIPFPYSHQTIFDGLDAMEYPMMVNNLPFEDRQESAQLTTHEIFHALFPFLVGTNETKHAFMDEGWATLSEFLLYPFVDPNGKLDYDISDINKSAGTAWDVPIMTPTPQLYGKARYANKDLKPALAYLYLMQMLGKDVFIKAMQHYIFTWQGKHPTPYDFFYSMNSFTGLNLDWFWNNWFFSKGIPDLAIGSVKKSGDQYKVVIENLGSELVPIHLTVFYQDGSKELISKHIGCWALGNKTVTIVVKTKKKIKELVLGTEFDVDSEKENNVLLGSSIEEIRQLE
ncbi:M1 family metallopeptidase [Dyadobacter luteus]|uniref:M1 family metallopeptidase n=1 Tax=Dyadobacter luteus TaxID=2259619 RepID=UPI001E5AD180|nr:M1 family metallopeptidase [Dyadobacter luteus]